MQNQETYHQTLAMMTIGLNEFAVAVDDSRLISSLSTLMIPNEDFILDYDQYLWIYSLDKYICRIFGAVIAAVLVDKLGRKALLSISAMAFCLTWFLMLFANSVSIIFVARIAFGIASGISNVTAPIYLGENSSPSIRGIFGTLIKSIYSLGYLTGFITAAFLHLKTTVRINFFITMLSLISIFWMVEPVQYLLMKGKFDQAKKNFVWLKGPDSEEVSQEFEIIKQNVDAESFKKSSSFIKIFTYPANHKSLLVMLITSTFVGLINYNLTALIDLLFVDNTSTYSLLLWNIFLISVGVTQFLVMASISFFIRRFNRRSMIIKLFSLISITLFLIAVLINTGSKKVISNIMLIFIHFCVLLLNSIYAFTFTIFFLLRSELFPLSIKAVGGSLSYIGYTLGGYFMTEMVSPSFRNLDFITFLFSSCGVILVLFLYYMKFPETENKSLIEIQEKLEGEN